MSIREQGLRRVAIVTTGIAVAGVAGATLVACTVTGAQPAITGTSQSTSDTQNPGGGTFVQPDNGGSPAHGHSGGS